MKRLVLVRHAKSSWANPLQSDFDRPLNDRGEHDAPMMGDRLKLAAVIPDLIIASTAKRAAQTAKLVGKGVGYDKEKIEWREELYHCVPAVFEEVIRDVKDDANTLFIVAHNPGISEFAMELDETHSIHSMPTCATAGFDIEAERWADFSLAKKKLAFYDTPKGDQ